MTTLAFLALAVAVPTGIFGAVCMLRLARDLNRDQRNGYQLPPEAMPNQRPCPPWVQRTIGRARK